MAERLQIGYLVFFYLFFEKMSSDGGEERKFRRDVPIKNGRKTAEMA